VCDKQVSIPRHAVPTRKMRSFTQSSAFPSLLAPPVVIAATPNPGSPVEDNQSHHPSPFGCHFVTPAHGPQRDTLAPSFFDVRDDSLLLSSQAKNHVTQAIQNGWADSTLKRYAGSIKQFLRFCDAEHVPPHLRFPADEFVLCAFAASSCGRHAGGTPRSRLSALKAWHVAHNVKWNGSARLRFVLNGVRNCAPSSSRRPPRPPVNSTMLSQLIRNLDLTSSLDAAVAACAVTAFWGQCRIGELLPVSPSLTPSLPLPSRSDFRRSVRNPHSYVLHLPVTKTHRNGEDVVLVDQSTPINPISLLKNHIRVNSVLDDQFLFSFTSDHGSSILSKTLFLQRCNAIWSVLGYPRTTGHCFRIGGTTELLILGTPPDVVKATGRWSSDSFLRYWRSLEEIAPRYIRYIHAIRRRHRRRRR
jgi:hypothetical protein